MPKKSSPVENNKTDPESFLYVEPTRAEKSSWVRAAQKEKLKLADWVIQKLNHEAARVLGEAPRFAKPQSSDTNP